VVGHVEVVDAGIPARALEGDDLVLLPRVEVYGTDETYVNAWVGGERRSEEWKVISYSTVRCVALAIVSLQGSFAPADLRSSFPSPSLLWLPEQSKHMKHPTI